MLKKLLFLIGLGSVLVACKKETQKALPKPDVSQELVTQECYLGIFKNDTLSMQLVVKGSQVTSGNLSYHRFEKDKNEGTLVGELKGDTLLAVYTFQSEGKTSVREVAFLKKETTYIEGFGESTENDSGKVTFKNTKLLQFNSQNALSKVACK